MTIGDDGVASRDNTGASWKRNAESPQPEGEQDERETFAVKHFTFGPCVHSGVKPDCPSCCQSHAAKMEMQLGKLEASTALPIRERVEKAVREHMAHCYEVYKGVPPTVDDWVGGALHYVLWGLERDIPLTRTVATPSPASETPVGGEAHHLPNWLWCGRCKAWIETAHQCGAQYVDRGTHFELVKPAAPGEEK